jgi:hypothetical protein
MIIGPAIASLIIVVCLIGIAVLHLLHLGSRLRAPVETSPQDPASGSSDRVANYSSPGPFISMPNDLKTRDQMVAWMTKELPKLTAQIAIQEKPKA